MVRRPLHSVLCYQASSLQFGSDKSDNPLDQAASPHGAPYLIHQILFYDSNGRTITGYFSTACYEPSRSKRSCHHLKESLCTHVRLQLTQQNTAITYGPCLLDPVFRFSCGILITFLSTIHRAPRILRYSESLFRNSSAQ